MRIESLETRRLFATGPIVAVENGVLTVTGTAGEDYVVIQQSRDGESLNVLAGVKGDSASRTKTTFATADVTSILVNAGDGNDVVRVSPRVELSATLNGEAGDDKLHGGGGDDELSGGDGADHLSGGAGEDTLLGNAGSDTLMAADRDGIDSIDGGDNDTPTDDEPGDVAFLDDADVDVLNVEETKSRAAGRWRPCEPPTVPEPDDSTDDTSDGSTDDETADDGNVDGGETTDDAPPPDFFFGHRPPPFFGWGHFPGFGHSPPDDGSADDDAASDGKTDDASDDATGGATFFSDPLRL